MNKKTLIGILIAAIVIIGVLISFVLMKNANYVVRFYSHQGVLISEQTVLRNSSAVPPIETGTLDGWVFTGWDSDFTSVKEDMSINAICNEISSIENAVIVCSAYDIDGMASVTVQLTGQVEIAGVDASIDYGGGALELIKIEYIDEDVTANCVADEHTLFFNFVSPQNVESTVDLMVLKFKINDTNKDIPIRIKINSTAKIQDEEVVEANATAIDGAVLISH